MKIGGSNKADSCTERTDGTTAASNTKTAKTVSTFATASIPNTVATDATVPAVGAASIHCNLGGSTSASANGIPTLTTFEYDTGIEPSLDTNGHIMSAPTFEYCSQAGFEEGQQFWGDGNAQAFQVAAGMDYVHDPFAFSMFSSNISLFTT